MLAINQYCDIAIGKVNKFDTKIAQRFPKQEREFYDCAEISARDTIRHDLRGRIVRLAPSVASRLATLSELLKFVRLRAPHPERYEPPPELARSLCAGPAGEGSRPDTRDLRPRAPSHPESSA
jgi:hypothetical protein